MFMIFPMLYVLPSSNKTRPLEPHFWKAARTAGLSSPLEAPEGTIHVSPCTKFVYSRKIDNVSRRE